MAWPDGYRITQFGNVPVEASEFTAHGIKSGSVTDLGMSKAPPALALAHAHQENMSTNAMYHVWELEATDYARNLLCQPRLVSAGLCISLMHVHAYVRIRMYAYACTHTHTPASLSLSRFAHFAHACACVRLMCMRMPQVHAHAHTSCACACICLVCMHMPHVHAHAYASSLPQVAL